MKIKIEFETSNAAFEDNLEKEIIFVLNSCFNKIHMHSYLTQEGSTSILDSNGNTIGKIEVTDEED